MVEGKENKEASSSAAEAAAPAPLPPIGMADIYKNLGLLARGTETGSLRLVLRALRGTTPIRRRGGPSLVGEAVGLFVPDDHPGKALMLTQLLVAQANHRPPQAEEATSISTGFADMDVVETKDSTAADAASGDQAGAASSPSPDSFKSPESETYVTMLALQAILKCSALSHEDKIHTTALALSRVSTFNRRSLDVLSSKIVFYYSLAFERAGRLSEARTTLMALHRTCCLRHDEFGQATVLNLLLRGLLDENLIDQAYKLASQTTFPESASNNQFCRYLYYMGRINALQLDYSDAYAKLMQSARKAPHNTALDFRIACTKLTIIVQLLLGEIPERSTFNTVGMQKALQPYLQLTQAVRLGNLLEFNKTVEQHKAIFQRDRSYTLIQRLAHNVIKTGLRMINIAYSRISLADLCEKVCLDNPSTAEFVCAKAIHDGVIDAELDHELGALKSSSQPDLYATDEPQLAFHKRVVFCLDVHNEAVRAMAYPPNAYKKQLEDARSNLDDKTEEELAKEIEDEMEDDL